MKISVMIGVALLGLSGTALYAAGDLSRADVQKIPMEMGTDDEGNMYFKPNHFDFETGKAYALVMTNVDDYKHELALNEMMERIFIRKVEIENTAGDLVAEIKGHINEVEVGPHQTVEWYFVPVQPGENIEITCEIDGHYDAGMHGMVDIH